MDDNQLYQIRPMIAEILEAVAKDGFPGARDMDVALDSIFCDFNEGPIAAVEARAEKAEKSLKPFGLIAECDLVRSGGTLTITDGNTMVMIESAAFLNASAALAKEQSNA